jgi:hypothetical protein
MNTSFKIVLSSLVGGLAIHGALMACGGGGRSAIAQSVPSSCAHCQVIAEGLPTDAYGHLALHAAEALDGGWEPFAATGSAVVLRQCAPPSP